MTHVAQYNIGRLRYDLEDPRVADFVKGLDTVNRIAERSPGFVWKYETGAGGVVEQRIQDDPRIVVNMTVWENVTALHHFVWNTLHKHFIERTREWFDTMPAAHFVMWWVPVGHRPDLAEAEDRLEQYRTGGPSKSVFGWSDVRELMGAGQ